ncbi:GNAT superfamily N-acetyltransferase [Methanococcus maripaludis]|uniref:GNAT superfamily N-acetyltransferase n=1 Tax=Methanococcus maripaludis TaxID=39152 RepID=A0A7J9NVD3_METMI|nr:GNAT family N-acetyltransferase [Methanococcus maripaludis]MBA2851629.1 GNAT superfamily N-acetyltransferase [Methanococcus maripaludis]
MGDLGNEEESIQFTKACLKQSRKFLYKHFKQNYPEIETWFEEKVVPALDTGGREMYSMNINCEIVGLVIIKFGETKNKICSFYLTPAARNLGLGTMLFNFVVRKLQSKNIVITVPEKRMAEQYKDRNLANFLEGFGFEMVSEVPQLYTDLSEFIFVKKAEA